jgi:hypothetical protein
VSELIPILGDDPTDDEKRLLDSARLDVPPRAGKRRTLAAMGLVAAMTTTAGTGGAATTAGAGLIVKWLALGALGGTIALGAVGSLAPLVRGLREHPSAVVAPRPLQAAVSTGRPSFGVSSAPGPAPVEALPSLPNVEALSPLPDVEAPIDPTPPVHATPSAPRILAQRVETTRPTDHPSTSVVDDTLTAEVTALDEARRALAAGEPGPALLSLDAYDRRFALRRLGPEAAVLRIEALMAAGRPDQAHQLGDQLLAAEPEGAYAQHVRSILSRASQ